jgi:sulfite exporter TauE/SafE
MENIDLLLILTTALLGGFGHCIGMCGGIVIAYSSTKMSDTASKVRQVTSHLSYNFGRVATYAVFGAFFGWLGQTVSFTMTTKGLLFIVTGVLMLLAALSLLGKMKFLNSVEFSLSKYVWYQKSFQYLMSSQSQGSFFLLGMLNGLIPCGLVYSFAIIAASTASAFWGMVVMVIFGVATIPSLLLLGTATKFLQQGGLRTVMLKIAAFLVLLYALFTIFKGVNFIANPEMMKAKMQQMMKEQPTMQGNQSKCGGMKCSPGKCG